MTENDYKEFVMSLCKPGSEILHEMTDRQAHLLHMAVGVAGEAGELLDVIKKSAIYQHSLGLENIIEELGDLEFYMAGIRQALDLTRKQVLQRNVDKLIIRYPKATFTNQDAQERKDKDA